MLLSNSSTIDDLQAEIDDVKKKIDKTNEDISILEQEIQELKKRGDVKSLDRETDLNLLLEYRNNLMDVLSKLMERRNILLGRDQQGLFFPRFFCLIVTA